MFEVGQVIDGKYRIDRELGHGGMGMVVAATHLKLGTPVAIKYLTGAFDKDATMVARFLREARAAAQLRSEHICRVVDVAEEGGSPYIVMELLEGTDLSKLSKAGPIEVGAVAEYVRQACAGLAEAHGRGIVHRDLKPANLFLTDRADGSVLVKVLDFGVAKAPDMPGTQGGPRLTGSVHLVGSPAYMSPEQIASSRDVDARTDVWSLGVILYRLLTGRNPFDGDNMAMLAMQIIDVPMPPMRMPNVPPSLEAIVRRCLEKDPLDRLQTATELAQLLRPFAGVAAVRETDIVPSVYPPATTELASTLDARRPSRPALPPRPAQGVPTLKMTPSGNTPAGSKMSLAETANLRASTPSIAAPSQPIGTAPSEPPAVAARSVTSASAPSRRRAWVSVVAGIAVVAIAVIGWQLSRNRNAAPVPAATATELAGSASVQPGGTTTDTAASDPAANEMPVTAAAPPKTAGSEASVTEPAEPTTQASTPEAATKPSTPHATTTKTSAAKSRPGVWKPSAVKPAEDRPAQTKPVQRPPEPEPTDLGASRI